MSINKKIIFVLIAVLLISVIYYYNFMDNNQKQQFFDFNINTSQADLEQLEIDSIFKISGGKGEFILDEEARLKQYTRLYFEFDEKNQATYDQLMNNDEKTVVIYPIFTASAYNQPGFYNYYSGQCDDNCLTVPIKLILRAEIGGNGAQILKLLNYKFLSDIDVDKNPDILKKFDKVILLHNEYVTQKEFDAITSHPKVIYLYPNALYAKIEVNYDQKTISLIRGHGYPDKTINNGFDWKYDNTHPYEYDIECDNWNFYDIPNGKMLNCYPDKLIYENSTLLKKLKDF
ncbi:hypothetical protein [Candidatus Nitrosarchaeum limnium]|jgi:hypothetical protein|uniref:Uncharacterized protein n=1 Tax=Candidatus Nitrosarchaeum limnium BG20 TaxID=859192 RepID=S2E8P4_9ARCH|nr:hypothetical protein [Candidatus Nitrosarchaeum limnium]EPA05801.1 hypothetical protein BG20_I1961 [Candidatus Nitrosarchaeum limnium BG20]